MADVTTNIYSWRGRVTRSTLSRRELNATSTTTPTTLSASVLPTAGFPSPTVIPATSSSASTTSPDGALPLQFIIGIVVGIGLLLLIAASIALCYQLRARKRARQAILRQHERKQRLPSGSEIEGRKDFWGSPPPYAHIDGAGEDQGQDPRLRGLALVARVANEDTTQSTQQEREGHGQHGKPAQQQKWQRYYGSGDYEHWLPRQVDRGQQIYHAVSPLNGANDGNATEHASDTGRSGRRGGWERLSGRS